MNLKHWDSVQQFDDPAGLVIKFVFTKSDAVVETVLYKYPSYEERTVICHSVMSGCPVGCRFCGTGDYFVRNLTVDEMIEQVEYAVRYTNIEPAFINKLQIMSMSMGEPMLNRNVDAVYRELNSMYPRAKLLMSTSGPDVDYEWFLKLSEDIYNVGMQFSIHESTDEARNKLIPFEKKLNINSINAVGTEFYLRTKRKPFFNYCASETNSSADDADRIYHAFDPSVWEATVSVICEQDNGMATSNSYQKILATDFSLMLIKLGFNVRVFDPAGQDTIGGGCGQLWFVQDWMKDNPGKMRRSIGFGKDKVHIPAR